MANGRDGATAKMVVLCVLVVALQYEVAQATTYVVGDDNGWTYSTSGWEKGKNFKAGDVLVFNYQKLAHNVVVVDEVGYAGCITSPKDAKEYTSGNDHITLVKGLNNFICTFPRHCDMGMKIQISAS